MARELMIDVSLSDIVFAGENGGITLDFLDMFDGGRVGTVSCQGVITFAYHDYADSGLPVYVGKVAVEETSGREALQLLRGLGYYIAQDDKDLRRRRLHHVCVEGSLMLHIVCQRVSFDRTRP